MTMIDVPNAPRLLLQAQLAPVQGSRFQPTGFPDVGAGIYTMPNGRENLLVESAQSVANRLEASAWDETTSDLVAPLQGLSYVRVVDADDQFLTSSIQEAHRLNSVYIEKSDFFEKQLKPALAFDEKKPVDRAKFLAALARFDINCLLHGVFLESISGGLRLPRALSGFIEAEGVGRVNTGGVKNDRVQASKDEESGKTAAEGFGNVPFHRTEFVAERITAYFNIDLEQLRGYRFGPALESLLFAVALFKVQRFLTSGLRLRTACDFSASALEVMAPAEYRVPSLGALAETIPNLIKSAAPHFSAPSVTQCKFLGADKKGKKAKSS